MSETVDAAARARRAATRLRHGRAWRVIVLNDDHNTFEGVAFALAQTIPGVDYDKAWRSRTDPHARPGARLVGPPELAELYHSQLEGYGLTLAPLER